MVWIKRNLFLAVSGLVLVVLAVSGFMFLFGNLSKSAALDEDIGSAESRLNGLRRAKPFPSSENIKLVKEQLEKVNKAVEESRKHFIPVPSSNVAGLEFKTLLDKTLADLSASARRSSVQLPAEDYAFSFEHEKGALRLPASSFPALPIQLAEVKAICDALFASEINLLESIRRPIIPNSGVPPSGNYHSIATRSNAVTGMLETPYEVSFACFSGELAEIMQALYKADHGFLVKALKVDSIPPEATALQRPAVPVRGAALRAARVQVAPKKALETVVDERRLRVSLYIHVVKPAS